MFIVIGLPRLVDTIVQLMRASLRARAALAAENLFLRRQLALCRERNLKACRPDRLARFTLAYLSRFYDWRNALVIVQPRTLIAWHRAGFRLFWRWKSRPGRPGERIKPGAEPFDTLCDSQAIVSWCVI